MTWIYWIQTDAWNGNLNDNVMNFAMKQNISIVANINLQTNS